METQNEKRIKQGVQMIFCAMIFFILYMTCGYVIRYFVKQSLIASMCSGLLMLPMMFKVASRYQTNQGDEKIQPSTWVRMINITIIGQVLIEVVSRLVVIVLRVPIAIKTMEQAQEIPFVLQVVIMAIIGPIVEELIFRRFLYRGLKQCRIPYAMFISSILFGIAHGNIRQFIFATGMGMIYCYFYERYQEIKVPIILHMLTNLFAVTFSMMSLPIVVSIIVIDLFIICWMKQKEVSSYEITN